MVIAALLGAIVLAVVSPSVPGAAEGIGVAPIEASPTPRASGPVDTRLPAAQPEIIDPTSGLLVDEWEIEVKLRVPAEELRRKELTLVVLRGDDVIGSMERPKLDGTNVVSGVRLVEGLNELTAALEGPGGLGPRSEAVDVTLDRDAPQLQITAPGNKAKTFEDTIEVAGTSEVGAKVRIVNPAKDFDPGPLTVGPDGDFSLDVPLKKGRNVITASSQSQAGRPRNESVVVTRLDGKPVIELDAPQQVKRGRLPKEVKVAIDVTDSSGEPMADAPVNSYLQALGSPAENFEGQTNDKGRATWSFEVKRGSAESVTIVVSVTSPYGQARTVKQEIQLD